MFGPPSPPRRAGPSTPAMWSNGSTSRQTSPRTALSELPPIQNRLNTVTGTGFWPRSSLPNSAHTRVATSPATPGARGRRAPQRGSGRPATRRPARPGRDALGRDRRARVVSTTPAAGQVEDQTRREPDGSEAGCGVGEDRHARRQCGPPPGRSTGVAPRYGRTTPRVLSKRAATSAQLTISQNALTQSAFTFLYCR